MLREAELAYVTVDSNGTRLDEQRLTVSLFLSVQKTDPAARGAWRTLACCCARKPKICCPYHAVLYLVSQQKERCLRYGVQFGLDIPLVSQRGNPRTPAAKFKMIALAQKHAELLTHCVPEAANIEVLRVTGHFARRSGAKSWAREGIPLASIQWMSRHSSAVIMEYVEEAWSENPREAFRFQDVASIFELLTAAMTRVASLEENAHKQQHESKELETELKFLAEL